MSRAMASGGRYDAHSDYQLRGALAADDLVADLANAIEPHGGRAVVLAHYGCAQGRVTNALLHAALRRLCATHPTCRGRVHNDRLDNDWLTLLERPARPESYLRLPGGPITPLISATSFFLPATPPAIVDLGKGIDGLLPGVERTERRGGACPGSTGGGGAVRAGRVTGAGGHAALPVRSGWPRRSR